MLKTVLAISSDAFVPTKSNIFVTNITRSVNVSIIAIFHSYSVRALGWRNNVVANTRKLVIMNDVGGVGCISYVIVSMNAAIGVYTIIVSMNIQTTNTFIIAMNRHCCFGAIGYSYAMRAHISRHNS